LFPILPKADPVRRFLTEPEPACGVADPELVESELVESELVESVEDLP